MYTSGTTGKPKGAIRSHRGAAMLSLITEIELGIHRRDSALLVMPLCHANSLYFFGAFSYCGGSPASTRARASTRSIACGRSRGGGELHLPGADPLRDDAGPEPGRQGALRPHPHHPADDLLGPGPARHQAGGDGVLSQFRALRALRRHRGRLATMLHPPEQFTKLGSVGRECVGSAPIRSSTNPATRCRTARPASCVLLESLPVRRLLEAAGEDPGSVPRRVLHRRRHGPARRGRLHPSRRPQEQHDHLRRREHLPSEVEALLGGHPAVHDVAVVGLPDETWASASTRSSCCATALRHRSRDPRLVQGSPGRLQAPAHNLVPGGRGDAPDRDGQEPAPQAEGEAGAGGGGNPRLRP